MPPSKTIFAIKNIGRIMKLGAKTIKKQPQKDSRYKHSYYRSGSRPCAMTSLRKPHNQKHKEESYLGAMKTKGPY